MVLGVYPWESRSLPGKPKATSNEVVFYLPMITR
jgi:hypothetical protein